MASTKPLVLVVGASGNTGQSIVTGLLATGNFRVAALVRPASASKPAVESLRESGVEIRLGDLKNGVEKLKEALVGVAIFISAVDARSLEDQKDALRAAKEVGVQRVIPCDFATPTEKGVRELGDTKLAIREFVKELGVPYTFIDVGWWMQLTLPLPTRSASRLKPLTYQIHGPGDDKMLVTDIAHIGTYVARIVADPRTLYQAVIIWEDEVTQLEAHEIGERLSGEADVLKAKRVYITAEDLLKQIAEAKATLAKDPANVLAVMSVNWAQYMYSLHILRENTLENAKRLGFLDARELYPDIPKFSLEEFAKDYYAKEEPGEVYA
ncbi:NAD-P-binding protein [Trametes versicolor FP-101664 SS1]|uniref:NAD-P-binding protein n=1 Tax=Trametes versicolor (strain FP-101664) TaxID=717944 RepID=UPI0004622E54|nr:NAD-P-binding protein [Trametes versicolor FP-101664 SS1]EIW53909.1 NAD-P-binding protein [Trametes versicolor FP-101664 SS1]